MKNILVCTKCKEEFIDLDKAGKHSREKRHYEFKLKGTNKKLMFA
jgi:hypothetical protein